MTGAHDEVDAMRARLRQLGLDVDHVMCQRDAAAQQLATARAALKRVEQLAAGWAQAGGRAFGPRWDLRPHEVAAQVRAALRGAP